MYNFLQLTYNFAELPAIRLQLPVIFYKFMVHELIHYRKLPPQLLDYFGDKRYINDYNTDGWMEIDNKIAQIYMRTLAEYSIKCSGKDIVLGTDTSTHSREIYSPSRNRADIQAQCCKINIVNCLPQPSMDVSFEDILEFKNRRKDELNAFRAKIRELETNIYNADSPELIRHYETQFIEEWQQCSQDYYKALKDSRITFFLSSLVSLVGIPFVGQQLSAYIGQDVTSALQTGAQLLNIGIGYFDYIGVIRLDISIPCRIEVSGKTFKSKIAGHDILIIFPSIPDDYNHDQPDIQNGDLVVPHNLFKGQVKWGMVNAWPLGLFSVNALLCYASTDESGVREIYEDFPRWKEKLYKLNLIDTGNYLIPEQKLPALLVGGGFDDGFQVFEVEKGKPLRYIRNSRTVDNIQIRFVETKEAYTNSKLESIFQQAGSSNEIALAYELLITAYRAMERHDFRSAVILSGSAVEQAIINRLRSEYSSKSQFKQAKDTKPHRMLNGRFNWLIEKNIPIPIADYKKTIIGVRNDAAHDGIRPSHADTKLCLEHCKTLVETYNPDVQET